MHYILYRITNLVNGKIYVGVHKTRNLDDGYMGSGKLIRCAIKKYGVENFQKEILETFETAAKMYEREKQVVTWEFLERNDVYNVCRGGHGGFEFINKNKLNNSKNQYKKARQALGLKYPRGTTFTRHTEESKKKISRSLTGRAPTFAGRTHSYESRKKISDANKNLKGERNSQYGSFWITDGTVSKKCRGNIPEGWKRGRVIKS